MSAPMLVVGAVAVLSLTLPLVVATSALELQQRAGGAADAAALAAADASGGWIDAEPCALAARVAESFRVRLTHCEVDPESGTVRVVVRATTVLGELEARARAGPPGG